MSGVGWRGVRRKCLSAARARSLFDVLRKEGRPHARLARSAAVSVARGMAYLHSRQPLILHKASAPLKRIGFLFREPISKARTCAVMPQAGGLIKHFMFWEELRGCKLKLTARAMQDCACPAAAAASRWDAADGVQGRAGPQKPQHSSGRQLAHQGRGARPRARASLQAACRPRHALQGARGWLVKVTWDGACVTPHTVLCKHATLVGAGRGALLLARNPDHPARLFRSLGRPARLEALGAAPDRGACLPCRTLAWRSCEATFCPLPAPGLARPNGAPTSLFLTAVCELEATHSPPSLHFLHTVCMFASLA